MARPSKWKSHVEPKLNRVEAWARDGLTDQQIAHNLGIGLRTYYEYKERYPQFSQSLQKGKDDVDIQVENALFKRAMGYTYEEVQEIEKDGQVVEKKKTVKEVQPDTTAQIFWLKNRRPEIWRDKREVEARSEVVNRHEYHIEQTIQSDPESAELLKQLYKRSANATVGDPGEA